MGLVLFALIAVPVASALVFMLVPSRYPQLTRYVAFVSGAALFATFTLQRRISSSRLTPMNSWSLRFGTFAIAHIVCNVWAGGVFKTAQAANSGPGAV